MTTIMTETHTIMQVNTFSLEKHKGDNLGSQVRVRLPTVTHQRRQNLIYLLSSHLKADSDHGKEENMKILEIFSYNQKGIFVFARL